MRISPKVIFNKKPVLIMDLIVTLPLPNTIALGGVATGNINAKLQLMATALASTIGFRFIVAAIDITIGRSIFDVAVLEASSVAKIVT